MSSVTKASTGIGRRIERLRELRGMKQDALASILGVSQQTISRIEKSDTLDEEKLEQIAKALDVSVEAIKNFDIETAINLFNSIHSNQFDNHSVAIYQQFSPIEKIVELYEALLKSEREKIELLERLSGNGK